MYKILIIDNDHKFQVLLKRMLSNTLPGLQIYQAYELFNALTILKEETIDFLFIDISISQMSGIKFLKEIKEFNYKPFTIIISAGKYLYQPQQILDLEIAGYLIKPTTYLPLSSTLMNILESKQEPVQESRDVLMLSTAIGVCPVNRKTILAVEKTQRNLLNVYTQKRILKEVRGTLIEIFKSFSEDFVFINRQCIINRTAITRIMPKTREIFLDVENREMAFSCSRDKIRDLITWFNTTKKI